MPGILVDCRVVSEQIDGLSRYALGLTEALVRSPRDHVLTLLVPSALSPHHRLRQIASSPMVRAVASDVGMMSLASHVALAPTFRRVSPGLYHYPHFNMPLAAPSPSVITVHDVTPFVFPAFFGRWRPAKRAYFWLVTAVSARRARAVIVPTRASADAFADCFPFAADRLHVVHEGVDDVLRQERTRAELDAARARLRLPERYVLYVGVSRPHKNLARVIRAFATIAPEVPHDLVVAGQPLGATAEIRTLTRDLALEDRVRWLGYVADTDLAAVYRSADALVNCSLFEGFGLPVIEAMALGTPVVGSRDGAIHEVGGDAYLPVDPRDVGSIADGVRQVCLDESLRSRLRARGLVRARAFTWDAAAAATLRVYDQVLGTA